MTHDHLDAVAALNAAAVPAVADVDASALWRLVDQAVFAPVVVVDTAVVAFMIVLGPGLDYDSPNYGFFARRHADFAYVDRIVVAPPWQRRGLGAALYDAVEARVDATVPVLAAEVNVEPPNPGSLAFHAARGFEAVGEQDTHGGAQRVRLLVRPLRGPRRR
jgi:predicted GNAT superfamily acetyltransferase